MGVIFKNNVMYGAGDIEISPVCYSEEEREVGCWTDGKPLYQRTLFYTGDTLITVSGDSSSTYSVTGITDIYVNDILPTLDQLVHYQIDLTFDGNEKNIYHFEYCFQASTGTFIRSHNPGIAYIGYNITPGSSITLQYTKTTDQPGSGIWTPSGVKTVHYSENEQVVGTWTDGKTIYEKTFSEIPLGADGNYNLFSSGIDIAFLVSCYYVENGTGSTYTPSYISRYGASGNCSQSLELNNHSLTLWNQSTKSILWTGTVRYIKTV